MCGWGKTAKWILPLMRCKLLKISMAGDLNKAVVAIEVANVNTTQLVGETCRLYFDSCPLKLLILGDRNVPAEGKKQCENLLAKMFGQDDIRSTPARVALPGSFLPFLCTVHKYRHRDGTLVVSSCTVAKNAADSHRATPRCRILACQHTW